MRHGREILRGTEPPRDAENGAQARLPQSSGLLAAAQLTRQSCSARLSLS